MKITLSKAQWQQIGKTTGWIKRAQLAPEQEVEENKAQKSVENLDTRTEEVSEENEKETQLAWSYQTETTYDKPTGRDISVKYCTLTVYGTVYYPDFLQQIHGTLEDFVCDDCWRDAIDYDEIGSGEIKEFGKESFTSKKIGENDYEIVAKYSFQLINVDHPGPPEDW